MVVLTVDTLDYLYKGGRIGGAAHWIGTALDLKPQLTIDPVGGVIVPGKRVRTRSKAIEAVYQEFFAKMNTSRPMHIAVHHAKAATECEALAARVRSDYPNAEVIANEITPVIGTHAGPGALALCGYYEDWGIHETTDTAGRSGSIERVGPQG